MEEIIKQSTPGNAHHSESYRVTAEIDIAAAPTVNHRNAGVMSARTFVEFYLKFREIRSTSGRAIYEDMEEMRVYNTGYRRYSSYSSFRGALCRIRKKLL